MIKQYVNQQRNRRQTLNFNPTVTDGAIGSSSNVESFPTSTRSNTSFLNFPRQTSSTPQLRPLPFFYLIRPLQVRSVGKLYSWPTFFCVTLLSFFGCCGTLRDPFYYWLTLYLSDVHAVFRLETTST